MIIKAIWQTGLRTEYVNIIQIMDKETACCINSDGSITMLPLEELEVVSKKYTPEELKI